jgi:hypothetical protein
MIRTNLKGRIKNRDKVLSYIDSVCYSLLPRLKRTVDIDIEIVNKCDGENSALCWGDKDQVEIELARHSFDTKFTLEEMMLTLAHELVHAKQFIRGELHPNLNRWKRVDYANVPYSRTPWEKEAYMMEDVLFNEFWKKTV